MGILLVYDVTDERSFNNIRNWIRNIEQHASEGVNKILVGNKCDMLEKKVIIFYCITHNTNTGASTVERSLLIYVVFVIGMDL